MPPEKEVDDDIIVEDEGADDQTSDEVEIDLNDEEDDAAKKEREERDRNKAFASMRIENRELKNAVENLTKQVSTIQTRSAAPVNTSVPSGIPQTDEEWDALAEKDWKKAVDLRSIQNAQSILTKQQAAAKAETTLNTAKQKVLAAHPELNDNNSEKSKIFTQILEQNPDYLSLPNGPLYAMRDMEDYMENTLGYKREDIRSAERAGASREATRQHRIILNKGSGRTGAPPSGNKVVLDKDELEFCKFHNVDPKEYARNKQKLSKSGKTEGVSI